MDSRVPRNRPTGLACFRRFKNNWQSVLVISLLASIVCLLSLNTILLAQLGCNSADGNNNLPSTKTDWKIPSLTNFDASIESRYSKTALSKRKAVMVLAAVPLDKRHVTALWSELHCFTRNIDHVLLAAPLWSEPIIRELLVEVKQKLPQFASNKVSISAKFFVNDRYDVGLWCDGLKTLHGDEYDDVVLLNDSLFALREFSGVLDTLREENLRMTSLSYSARDPDGIWLESVFRGFDKKGLSTFMNHSCVPANHRFFCHLEKSSRDIKRCITEHHEIAIARLFPPDEVKGLYPSDVPEEMWMEHKPYATWTVHVPYWKEVLVSKMNFPAAKVTKRDMIKTMKNPLIQNCTRLFDRYILEGFNFSAGVRTIAK